MFRDIITETPLASSKADPYFKDKFAVINTCEFENDRSLVSTMRALLYDKLSDGEVFGLGLDTFSYENYSKIINRVSDRYPKIVDQTARSNRIFVFAPRKYVGQDGNGSDFPVDSMIEMLPEGYHLMNRVTELFVKTMPVYCFINEEYKSIIVIAFNLDIKKYHFLQCAIIGMMPWWYDTANIDDIRKELIYSLREKTSEKYCAVLNKIAQQLDFRSEFIKSSLSGFENYYIDNRISSLENIIREKNADIDTYSRCISDALASIRTFNDEYLALVNKKNADEGDSEIMYYFLSNKHLDLISVNEGDMRFVASDYLSIYDEDEAECQIKNKNSYFYTRRANLPPTDDFQKLLLAIFIERKIKIKFCAAYYMSISSMSVRACQGFRYGVAFSNYMPNPHIDKYECIGTYRQLFNEGLKNGNYIYVLEQAIDSARNLNFHDPTVMNSFVDVLLGNTATGAPNSDKCLELPDGRMVGVKDALIWLKSEEGE